MLVRCVADSRLFDDGFESPPLGLHTNVAVVLEHLFRDMPGDVHDRLVPGAALRQLGNEGVPVVVKTSRHRGVIAHIAPRRFQCCYVARGIGRLRFSEREDIPLRPDLSELLLVPFDIFE